MVTFKMLIVLLISTQDLLEMPQLKLVKAADTCWLSHDQAVSVLQRTYDAVVTSLERAATERHAATAAGLENFVRSVNFIASLVMLEDILPVLTILSKMFQVCAI